MYISDYKNYNNVSFNAGLNSKIKLRKILTSTEQTERELNKKYGIYANFENNNTIAFVNLLCADIFEQLGNALRFNITAPPVIKVYKQKDLILNDKYINFCIPENSKLFKDNEIYPAGSVFFKDYKSLNQIDNITENLYKNGKISSNHFLAMFIHEWLHSIHLDHIYKKFGYNGDCEYLSKIYPKPDNTKTLTINDLQQKFLSEEESKTVKEELDLYAGEKNNQYFEVFSEMFTKLICGSISKDCKLIRNPIDLFKKTPEKLQKIVIKAFNME